MRDYDRAARERKAAAQAVAQVKAEKAAKAKARREANKAAAQRPRPNIHVSRASPGHASTSSTNP